LIEDLYSLLLNAIILLDHPVRLLVGLPFTAMSQSIFIEDPAVDISIGSFKIIEG